MAELVDALDSKSGEIYSRAGSSPAHGTKTLIFSNRSADILCQKNYFCAFKIVCKISFLKIKTQVCQHTTCLAIELSEYIIFF